MTSQEVEQTQKTKRVRESPSKFSSLPDEITENILARVSRWQYPSLSLVSKKFHSLLSSMEIYKTRSQIGAQETCVYVLLELHDHPCWFSLWTKPNNQDSSGISVVTIPSPPTDYFPGLRSIKTFGSYMYIIGGPYKEPSSSVWIFDCRSHTWRDGPNMYVARNSPHTVLLDEKIYVMGGCDIDEYYANWIEVFDQKTQSWTAFPGPNVDKLLKHLRKSHCDTVYVFEGKIYFMAGVKEYSYEPKDGTWKLVKEISSFLFDDSVWTWCEIGKIICCYTHPGYLMWSASEIEGRVWREIKGLEELREHPTRGLKHGYTFTLLDCGGQILVLWDLQCPFTSPTRSNKIWYAKISLEPRCNGREVWGNVECVHVLTFPAKSYGWSSCLTAFV
ncbi:unnamed protein product [Eruca vesicaria subsp. sativa]|uniref:F-box domain-containing protein n=1 Tax=Eruca vesicaria subsp. sativa TaxID=29727 RepID=A0ABC8KRC3_ERUVS|nr:unnamed protein product [Eruca vesicaria subsp. sativa]